MRKFYLFFLLCGLSFSLYAQTLTLTGKLNVARQSHGSAEIDANRILVFGGQYGDPLIPGVLASSELYNLSTGLWTLSYPMNHPRSAFATQKLNSPHTLVIGGLATVGYIDSAKVSCELLDHNSLKWSFTGNLNVSRVGAISVKLQSGKILVAGGGNEKRCELYDPATGKWTFTGALNEARQIGSSIVLLSDGRALITGGSTIDRRDQKSAEIYDPVTESWSLLETSMNEFRYFHQTILLQDGRVMIVGGANHAPDGYLNTTEYFDPSTFTFTPGPSLAVARNASPLIRLANGDILTYGEGLFDLVNTKCIEVYSNQTQTWIASSSTVLGSDFYTINTIGSNGDKLLIAGGSSQTTIEPKDQAYLVNLPSCGTLVLDLPASGNKICEGLNGTVTLKNSVPNIKYQVYKGDSPITAIGIGTGNDLLFTVPSSTLNVGLNSLTVKTSGYASGCPFIPLADTAGIMVTQSLTAPVITALGATEFCSGSSVNLMASAGFNSYIWSNGKTTQTVNINTTGTFTVKGKDASGCTSPSSIGTTVSFITASAQAGPDQIVCLTAAPFQLSGFSPAGGTWSGIGVTANGLFNPSLAGLTTVTLTYKICNSSATKTIKIEGPPVMGNFTISKSGSYFNPTTNYFCQTSQIYHVIQNSNSAYSYQLRDSTGYSYPPLHAGSDDVYYNYFTHTTVLNVRESFTNSCGNFEYIRYDTLYINPWPVHVNVVAPYDTICRTNEIVFKIVNSSPGLKYKIAGYTQFTPGNNDTLAITFHEFYPPASTYPVQCKLVVQRVDNYCPEMTAFDKPIINYDHHIDFKADQSAYMLNGNQVKLNNLSTGNFYKWHFDNSASIAYSEEVNPSAYHYNSPGRKAIQLISNSKFCGTDTITKYTNVFEPTAATPGNLCLMDTLSIKPIRDFFNLTTAFHTDKQNNSYVAGFDMLVLGANYSSGNVMYLHKYDAGGKLIWKHKQNIADYNGAAYAPDYYSSYINGITTDDNGNVYIAGSFSNRLLRYGDLVSDLRNGSPIETFIIKIDVSGTGQWMIFGKNTDEDGYSYNARGATDILYVDDEHIYVSLGNPKKMVFADHSTIDLGNNKLSILQINKDGKYKKQFDATTYNMSNWGYRFMPINGILYDRQKVGVSPVMKLSKDGRIFVSGEFTKALDFGVTQLNSELSDVNVGASYAPLTNFVAVLDTASGWQKAFMTHMRKSFYNDDDGGKSSLMSKFALDDENNIYLTSNYGNGYFKFTSNNVTLSDSSGSVLAKFDENGNVIWYNHNTYCRPTGISYVQNQIMCYGELTNGYLGQFSQTVSPKMIRTNGQSDIYLSSTDKDGNLNWLNRIGGLKYDKAFFMNTNSCDEINFIGSFGSRGGFNGDTIYYGNGNIFLARYSLTGNCQTVCNNATSPLKVSISTLKEQDKINFSPIPMKFVFNRDVTGFDISDITVSGGTLSGFTGSGSLYTAQIIPSANGSLVTVQVPANKASDGSVQNIASNVFKVTYDNSRPTVTLTPSLPAYFIKTTPFTVSIDFSENVLNFTQQNIKLTNCTITNLTNSGYTNKKFVATIQPIQEGLLSIEIPDAIVSDSADNLNMASAILYKKYDVTRPTLTITSALPAYSKINSPVLLTITFSEYVSNMSLSKIDGLSAFTFSNLIGDGKVFTVTATPVQSGLKYFIISNVADSSGNVNLINSSYYFQNDITKPSVVISSSASTTTSLNPIPFTFTFSETVYGFEANDITVTNGTISSLSGSDKTYTAYITPSAAGLVSLQIPALMLQDSIGNYNVASSVFSRTYDNVRASLVISTTAPNPTRLNIPIAFTFSKAVTDFTISDIVVTNGTLSTFSGSNKNYTVTVIPSNQGTVVVSVAENVAMDASLNGNMAGNQLSIQFDSKKPSVSIVTDSDTPTSDALVAITIVFSEPVTGFTLSDIVPSNCTLSDFSGSGDLYNVTLHTASIGVVSLSIAASVCIDPAGNANTAATLTTRYRGNDYTKPIINISTTASNPSTASSIPIKFTLSETATGFASSDLRVTNGSIAGFSGSGLVYTVTLIAASYGDVILSVNDAAIMDIAGNTSDPVEFTFTYFQPVKPELIISAPANSNTSGIPVYFTFTSAMTGFTINDIIVTNGTLNGFSGNGSNYMVLVDPLSEGLVTISVNADAAIDASSIGNSASNIVNIQYDIQQPVASITANASNPTFDKTFTITISFSEPVANFTMNNLMITNAILSNFSGSGTSYTIEVTAINEGDVFVALQNNVTDAAGNIAIAEDFSIHYTESVTMIRENSLNNVVVYPNPFSGTMTIEKAILTEESEIIITNSIGVQVLYDKILASDLKKIMDLSFLPNGIYTVTLKNNNQVKDILIVLQR